MAQDEGARGETGDKRGEILASARKVIAREGLQKFTLSAIARDAGVPRNAVYGTFRTKNEILLAIVADDLTGVARAMRRSEGPAACEPLPHADLMAALVEGAEHPIRPKLAADTILPPPADAASQEDEASTQPDDGSEQMPPIAKKRGDASQLHDIINRLSVSAAPLGEGSANAIARIDRRMGVVEKALADLDERFDKLEKLANDGVKDTETSLERLVQRAERTDQRIAETATTLRGEFLDAFTHIEIPKAEPLKVTPPPDEAESEITVSDIAPNADTEPEPESGIGAEPQGDLRTQLKRQISGEDYLANARRSASEAAAAQDVPPIIRKRRKRRRHLLSRNQLLAIGALSILVILATMGIALSEGFIDMQHGHIGLPAAAAVPHPVPAAIKPQHVALAAPSVSTPAPVATVIATAPETPPRKLSPLEHIEALAAGGNTRAALIVGVKYLDGDGVIRNDATAARWLERAAKAGEPVAQYRLGTLYQRGAGVVKDEAQALHWYQAAANQGNRKAMHNLGVFYAEGRGTTQDYEKAAGWFTRAAKMGYLDSQFDLAVLYERGAGVPQSLTDAYKWYAVAAREGDDVSKARIEVLETQLDPHELATARAAAGAFKPEPLSRAANITPRPDALALSR